MRTVLTIAGSDCSGGAGIQADLKTITAYGMYGESAVTALTAQNTMGVTDVMQVPPEFLEKQLDCIFTDIYPDAVKIGMIPDVGQIEVIAKALQKYGAEHIVADTVLVSTSGRKLMEPEAVERYCTSLLPLAEVITPNIPEAEFLTGEKIKSREERVAAARTFALQYGCAVLVKGGHDAGQADDLLLEEGRIFWFSQKKIENKNTHGTGCTLSSAIACGLAAGCGVRESVRMAKEYITGAICDKMDLGKGNGPLNHMYRIPKGIILDEEKSHDTVHRTVPVMRGLGDYPDFRRE